MKQQPIKIPAPITPRRFAIPLVEGVDERRAMEDWEQYTQVLAAWGFIELASAKSLCYRDAKNDYGKRRIEDYAVWAHPKGVIARLHSYSSPAYRSSLQDKEVPARHTLGSATFHAMVDAGNGGELQHRAAVNVRGSGGSTPFFDGRCVREISETVHSNTSETLGSFMRMIQPHGRLLPFSEWGKSGGRFHLDICEEILAPLTRVEQLDALPGQDVLDEAFWELMKTLPDDIAEVFQEERRRDAAFRSRDRSQQHTGLKWDPVEFALNEFSEAMFLAGKRWPKAEESALLEHWAQVALGAVGSDLDPVAMRAYEVGPAGLSLPVALLYAKRTAKQAEGLLQQLLEAAPEDVLRRWATEVDGAGYTLGLRAVDRIFIERILDSHAPAGTDVLGILHQRLGNAGVVMSTPTRSLLGKPLEARHGAGAPKAHILAAQHSELAAVVQRLDDWGVEWAQHLRWRNYPNLFRDKDKPCFTQVNGMVDPGQWKALMDDNWTAGLDAIGSRLEAARIEQSTVNIAAPSRPYVRRM